MSASQHPIGDGEIVDPVLGKRHATHARIRARSLAVPKLETVEEREDYIELLFLEHIWTDHTSRECQWACAEAWGVKMTTVRDYSAAASRKIHARARDEGGRYAAIALRALSTVASDGAESDIPGDKNAAVNASEKLLKFAGLAEPEEDKQRPTTLVQVGQVLASPVFGALLAGHEPKKLNGHTNGASGQTNGHAEGADVVPDGGRDSAVGRKA